MISDHIKDVITAVKANPNGINRNKAVSHLEDALAHCLVMEYNVGDDATLRQRSNAIDIPGRVCICPEGAVDATCPVDGFKAV